MTTPKTNLPKPAFDKAATTTPPATSNQDTDMSAAEAVLINVFDWDYHMAFGGQRMGPLEFKLLDQTLQTNIKGTCPDIDASDMLGHFADMLHNRWAGDILQIRETTRQIIDACLQAQNGEARSLTGMTRQLARRCAYLEKHYGANDQPSELPVHVVAEAMEASEDGAKYHSAHKRSDELNTMRTLIDKMPSGHVKNKKPGLFGLLKP